MISWENLARCVPQLAEIEPWNETEGLNSLGLPMHPSQCRVVVAMSGGVDSTVVAGLLKAQGYDVVGITLQLYDHGRAVGKVGACCGTEDVIDARIAAASFDIPYYVLDYKDEFRASVIEPFADTYLAGATPVPCALCNKTVKFDSLLGQAKKLGAQALATGHYVQSRRENDGDWSLWRGTDTERDQSWFLYQITAEQLAFTRFPIGGLEKSVTRTIGRHLGLNIAEKPDSQDICFVPNGRYADVLAKLRPDASRRGKIMHIDGTELGEHSGVFQFTVGQRRGLGVTVGEPLFVVRIDAVSAIVTVGPKSALLTQNIELREVNWLVDPAHANGEPRRTSQNREQSDNADGAASDRAVGVDADRDVDKGAGADVEMDADGGVASELVYPVAVRMRSSEELSDADFHRTSSGGVVREWVSLREPRGAISPGQSCVFYDAANRQRVLGGGTIIAAPAYGEPFAAAEHKQQQVSAIAEAAL